MIQLLDLQPWNLTDWSDAIQAVHLHLPHGWIGIAQEFKQPDFTGDVSKSWNHFVKTGQVWAFLIGIGAGYMAKTFTSFG